MAAALRLGPGGSGCPWGLSRVFQNRRAETNVTASSESAGAGVSYFPLLRAQVSQSQVKVCCQNMGEKNPGPEGSRRWGAHPVCTPTARQALCGAPPCLAPGGFPRRGGTCVPNSCLSAAGAEAGGGRVTGHACAARGGEARIRAPPVGASAQSRAFSRGAWGVPCPGSPVTFTLCSSHPAVKKKYIFASQPSPHR